MFDKLVRTIATDQPRVTKFKINWDSENSAAVNGAQDQVQSTIEATGNNFFNGQDSEMACDDNMAMKPNMM